VLFVTHPFTDALSLATIEQHRHFVILGGTGKIGTAVAAHLRLRAPKSQITLVGRRNVDTAVQEVMSSQSDTHGVVKGVEVVDVWDTSDETMQNLFRSADAVIHTAGPFFEQSPTTLKLAIQCNVRVYIDVSDPLPFLETSLLQNHTAVSAGTTAMLASGAFPGMSNVLAVEASAALNDKVHNCYFNYFTAGLGGSGALNLYITKYASPKDICESLLLPLSLTHCFPFFFSLGRLAAKDLEMQWHNTMQVI
jgi:saccharopine dehydrogenase-like NADP-dependent oxidoreductase